MDPTNHWLVALEGSEVLGIASITENEENIHETTTMYSLWNLCVLPQWRRKGIGRQIISVALTKFQGSMMLKVEKNNPAVALYNDMGFVVVQIESRFRKVDVLVMLRPAQKANSLVQTFQSPTSVASSRVQANDVALKSSL